MNGRSMHGKILGKRHRHHGIIKKDACANQILQTRVTKADLSLDF